MAKRTPARLRELETLARTFGPEAAARKLELLRDVAAERLPSADAVLRLHEVALFLRALPDDERVLAEAERVLAGFSARGDLRRFRSALADSGIEGTEVRFGFYAATARWLARRWPDRLTIEWRQVEDAERLKDRVYLLGLDAETPGLDHARLSARGWIDRMRRPDETDAAYVVRRLAALPWDPTLRDLLFDELGLPLVLRTGPGTPSRTSAYAGAGSGRKRHWQRGPWRRPRPDLARDVRRAPLAVRAVGRREGQALVDLARGAMVTRARDLDAFAGGDPNDVRLVDCGDGLEFALIGSAPEWRMMLEGVYGWLMLRNRVPIGYVLTSALYRSSEIAFNLFDTWRGGDAAWLYGRVLATTRALFGAETFTIYPYQLGHGNPEGLRSGAWWFYRKLGFRPRDPEVIALMEEEQGRIRRDPRHRSSIATLRRLARANVYLETGPRRATVIGTFPFDRVGLAVTDFLAERFGSDRQRAERVCAEEVARALGGVRWRTFRAQERRAWLRWSPLLAILPGLDGWSRAQARDLVQVVRAKGGRRESDYVRLFDAHPRLGRALVRLAGRG